METIKLGGIELEATQVLDLKQSSKVPEHRTEKQFSVSDHIVHEPKEFLIRCVLFKGSTEYEALRKLYDDKEPVRFESELDDLDDMVMMGFDLSKDGLDTYRAEISIRQIRKAELKTRIVAFDDPATGMEVETGEEQGSNTAVIPSENNAASKPAKQENKTWIDSIMSWLGGLF